jgi:hypothetical protein
MTSEHSDTLTQTISDPASSKLDSREYGEDGHSGLVSETSPALQMEPTSPTNENDGEEQALESHEVIELQTFSERKAWIEEKIKVSLSSVAIIFCLVI